MLHRAAKLLTVVGLTMGFGLVQAAAEDSQRDMPATTHQIQTLNLNSGAGSNPRYQFSRKSADYAAVMPVTGHQANVLNLQNVNSRINSARKGGQAS